MSTASAGPPDPIRDGDRLDLEIFQLPVERMKVGYYSDKYFVRARDVLIALELGWEGQGVSAANLVWDVCEQVVHRRQAHGFEHLLLASQIGQLVHHFAVPLAVLASSSVSMVCQNRLNHWATHYYYLGGARIAR